MENALPLPIAHPVTKCSNISSLAQECEDSIRQLSAGRAACSGTTAFFLQKDQLPHPL